MKLPELNEKYSAEILANLKTPEGREKVAQALDGTFSVGMIFAQSVPNSTLSVKNKADMLGKARACLRLAQGVAEAADKEGVTMPDTFISRLNELRAEMTEAEESALVFNPVGQA